MRTVRIVLATVAAAAALVPAAASADGRCKPYFYEDNVGGQTVTMVGIVC